MEEFGFYGIALDGHGELCRVMASNAGHLLAFGLPSRERGEAVVRALESTLFHTGWGVRTLAASQARFNPMAYHNGSVWPHDNALCARGLARYGGKAAAVRLLQALFQAAVNFDMRLPELFCGFPRRRGEPPTAYPVACLPQAWAAGSPFMMLEACLGITIDAERREVADRTADAARRYRLARNRRSAGRRFVRVDHLPPRLARRWSPRRSRAMCGWSRCCKPLAGHEAHAGSAVACDVPGGNICCHPYRPFARSIACPTVSTSSPP